MDEFKTPRRPLMTYYLIALAVILFLNIFLFPLVNSGRIKQVDYGTFMKMTEENKIEEVELQTNQILFKDADGTVYRTGLMQDDDLVNRLYDAGVTFSSEIVTQTSPLLSFLLSWLIPIGIFLFLGRLVRNKLQNKESGGNAMFFGGNPFGGFGKSNAKIYVKSSDGIRFQDVAGEDEAKETCRKS